MAERIWLKLLLRVGGATMCLAIFAVFIPVSWMACCHRLLGLGEFPTQPIAEYLARVTSGLCAISGAVLLVASSDVRRYGLLISVFSAGCIVMAVGVLAFMTAKGGLAALYASLDAGSAIVFFAAILILQRRLARHGAGPKSP